MDLVWEVMSEHLYFVHHAFSLKIHAFVLMNNHFHLLARTPESNLSEAMSWFMRETSRELTRLGNRINQTYGGRYFRTVIGTQNYYLNAYKYFYFNPINAGLCTDVMNYPYSTLPALLGQRRTIIPLEEDDTLFSDVDGTMKWLNQKPTQKNWEDVRKALRKKEFKLARINNRPHPLEDDAL